jgi:ribosomal protein L31E
MKLRVALVTVIVAAMAAALTVAAPATSAKTPAGTETTTTNTTTTGPPQEKVCRPRLLVVTGTLVSVADDQLSFTMLVKHSNRHARAYEGQTITVKVDVNTKIWRLGKKVALGELTLGDRLIVQSRVCKGATDPIVPLAARVRARPAPTPRVCRPRFALILRGPLASVADDQLSFTMLVKHSNKHARAHEGRTITVQVDANTKVWRLGEKVTLGELTLGDRLVVQTRACKKGTDVTAPLLAARVVAKPVTPAPTTTTG